MKANLTTNLCFLLFAGVSWSAVEAFRPLQRGRCRCIYTSSSSALCLLSSLQHEEDIERLMTEYQQLQNKLWSDIRHVHRIEALKDVEGMLEKAVDMTALKRYQQENRIMQAAEIEASSTSKVEYAQQLKEKAHQESQWAENEAALVESIEDGYEDLERLRDLSVAHAAHQVEKDADELSFDGTFEGFVARINRMEATDLLKLLHLKEKNLKATLKQVRALENQQNMEDWAKRELPHHEVVIKVAKRHKLIDHDPTKGNVAF
jgi:hypothetical protein